MLEPERPRIALHHVLATANALQTLDHASIHEALSRHQRGDWGDLTDEDHEANTSALQTGGSLFSLYHDNRGTKFYIITEPDRSVTTVLLPEDY